MARKTAALTAYMEATVYQTSQMSTEEGNAKMGGTAALLKAQATSTLQYVSDEAVTLMGGRESQMVMQGEFRKFKSLKIPGGSVDVVLDSGARQA